MLKQIEIGCGSGTVPAFSEISLASPMRTQKGIIVCILSLPESCALYQLFKCGRRGQRMTRRVFGCPPAQCRLELLIASCSAVDFMSCKAGEKADRDTDYKPKNQFI